MSHISLPISTWSVVTTLSGTVSKILPHLQCTDDESKIIKKVLVIKEICSWLPPGLDGWKVCSQEHISLSTNSF